MRRRHNQRASLPVPAPYGNTGRNLPSNFTGLPFVLLRDHLYPNNQGIFKHAIAEHRNSNFRPFAFLHTAYGPFSHPVDGVRAVWQAQQQLAHLQRVSAASSPGVPSSAQYVPAQPVYHGVVSQPVPGYRVHDVPFRPRFGLPPEGQRVRYVLQQHPQLLTAQRAGAPPLVAQQEPETLSRALSASYVTDPVMGPPVRGPVRYGAW